MVMDKKGFLKILESIVAIIIVLGFVIALVPSKPKSQARLPPDLEQTTNSILKEMQESPEFRKCILGEHNQYFQDAIGAECVYSYIDFITKPKAVHPWNYAVDVCKLGPASVVCETNQFPNYSFASDPTFQITGRQELPADKSIYIKTVTISVEDVLGEGKVGEPIVVEEVEQLERAGNRHIITIFAWSKS